MTLNMILTIATILGGIAAVWFFWDKIVEFFKSDRLQHPSHKNIANLILVLRSRRLEEKSNEYEADHLVCPQSKSPLRNEPSG